MEEGLNPREILGLTQSQIASLLKVSRSLWSMYERKDRYLSDSASSVLNEMLVYAQSAEAKTAPKTEQQLEQAAALQEALKEMLDENEFQREHVSRKLAPLEKKYQAQCNALPLLAYLKAKDPNADEREIKLLEIITSLVTRGVTTKMIIQMSKWQIKLEQLQAEKQWLEERLKIMGYKL
ncbi:hypothetical protein [Flavobacterium sp.]|jgi:transcriptional regulator with XRE-family HTH domain|uniref:hypothetical protein n=1 Tax=Flavobacterium sp. TaxID=239 RepID=UPI0037850F7D